MAGKNFRASDAARITDGPTKDLLFKVVRYIEQLPLLSFGFDFVEAEFNAAGNFDIAHSKGFVPKDIIQLSVVGTGAITFNYAQFDERNVKVTTTGPCTVRFLVGTYRSE